MCWNAPKFEWSGTGHLMTLWLSPCKKMREEYRTPWDNVPVEEASSQMLLCAISYVAPVNETMLNYLYAELERRAEENP